jgi:hypothetical protein
MFKKTLAASFAGLSLSMVAAGTASASVTAGPSSGFGGSGTIVDGEQKGVLTVNSPLVDLRCATPWYGSAVAGASTPIGSGDVVCDDVKSVVTMLSEGKNGVLQ